MFGWLIETVTVERWNLYTMALSALAFLFLATYFLYKAGVYRQKLLLTGINPDEKTPPTDKRQEDSRAHPGGFTNRAQNRRDEKATKNP